MLQLLQLAVPFEPSPGECVRVEVAKPSDSTKPTESDAAVQAALRGTPAQIVVPPIEDKSLSSRVRDRILRRWVDTVAKVSELEPGLKNVSDRDLRKKSLALRYRSRAGEPLVDLLPEAYALIREASCRTTGMRHFDVQILGGTALFHGSVAEMETGEGKTLTATLPLYLRSLPGKGALLATVNDYLASRDARDMGPIYRMLGMSVGVVETDMSRPDRHKSYACDITYGTAKEFGFDLLRDRLLIRQMGAESLGVPGLDSAPDAGGEQPVQREAYFALVDEADSILIDEARTPLIISAMPGEAELLAVECYKWASTVADNFEEDEHYEYDHKKKTVELTLGGRQLVRALQRPEALNPVGLVNLYQYIEQAVKVDRDFLLDTAYVVRDDEIVIVDEFTGRLSEGRKWRAGIHQAIEAKEGVEVTAETGQAARITVQDLFLRFKHLAGMTGTAATSARELRKIYRLHVVCVPTNRPCQREILPERILGTSAEKWEAIVEEIRKLHTEGRPVLIGTRSIEKSELLAGLLEKYNIEHQVLNAHQVALEAGIVSEAGEPGRVTVSTNMAGRGTDIKLGENVAPSGGLHVICTEIHDSARIDRQLIGRCGRQGDPGTVRQFLALDDEILETGFGPDKARRFKELGGQGGDYEQLVKTFRRAQRKVERRHFRQRMAMMHHEKQLKKMHREMGQDPYLDVSH